MGGSGGSLMGENVGLGRVRGRKREEREGRTWRDGMWKAGRRRAWPWVLDIR